MYNRQRPHLYYGDENLKYYLTPSPADFLTRRAALRNNYILEHSLHIRGRVGWGSLLNLLMSMDKPRHHNKPGPVGVFNVILCGL
jgi:hypothetical protein